MGVVIAFLAAANASAPPAIPRDPSAIVVTGERVKRSLKNTSSSVIVVGKTEIEGSGADRVDQLLAATPNVQLGSGSQGPAIRGLDTTGALNALPAFLGGNRPRTTVVVDGRAVTYNEFVFGTFPIWDLDRIEVFRSPQTTTQGANSIAGAIFVDSNDPVFRAEYGARAILGDFRMRGASAMASAPLSKDVAVSVAGDYRYSRTTSHIAPLMAGADPNHDVFGVVRAKVLVLPAPETRLVFTYAHNESQAPQIVGVDAPFRARQDRSAGYGIFRVNVDSLTAALRQGLSKNITANLTLTAGDSHSRRFAIRHFGETMNDGRDWSAEAIINWSSQGLLRATIGVSHQHLALQQFIDLGLLSGSIGRFRDWQDGTGIFGEAEVPLFDRATMTTGLRYQHDRQKRRGSLTAMTFAVPVDFVGQFHSWLPKLSFAYDLSSVVRIGAMVEKAYNPGGTTIRVDTSRPDNFDAEYLWDYELFARAQKGELTASANLFYYDMRNAQRSRDIGLFTPSGGRVGFANLFNVPRARSYGAEAQAHWRPIKSLSANLSMGFLGTKILRSDPEVPDIQGKEFDRSPHFTGSAMVDWSPTLRVRLSGQVRHHGAYFSDPENSPQTRIPGATIVDARAEYRLARFSVFAQIRNLFDSLGLLDLGSATEGEAEDPRTFAFGLEARF